MFHHLDVGYCMIIGIISGVISGIIVALMVELFRVLRRGSLELAAVIDGKGKLRNNLWLPVVIGGTWALEKGPVVHRADGFRGGHSGIVLDPLEQIIVDTPQFQPGQSMTVTRRIVMWWPLLSLPKRRRSRLERLECDPWELIGKEKTKQNGWAIRQISYKV
ncbi:hypothetical protein ACTRLV_08980 [Corynebacterium durum]|jgi:hypothetical protein|uniref:hypothetical protein n=1 Tax=Corynebacterium durum TaxID=61592 RepID=UPI004042E75E